MAIRANFAEDAFGHQEFSQFIEHRLNFGLHTFYVEVFSAIVAFLASSH
jgi:hypothetical protein